jgi:hypothetical protein
LELGTCANRFLVPENPRVPKISQFGEKNFFRDLAINGAPPLMGKSRKSIIERNFSADPPPPFWKRNLWMTPKPKP